MHPRLALPVILSLLVAGCAQKPVLRARDLAPQPSASAEPSAAATSAAPSPSPSPSRSPSPKPKPKPTATLKKTVTAGGDVGSAPVVVPTNDGVPLRGAGTFTIATGGTEVVGTGAVLVKYRAEIEDGIDWGTNTVWTASSFAGRVERIVASSQSWMRSAEAPITNSAEGMTNASWSFQRVSGDDYSVKVRLATPETVDRMCGAYGVRTQGVYSCRFGNTIMINLRRWLRGAVGFPMDANTFQHMMINHEMGHFLGFDHMLCPGSGQAAPVMQTQSIGLNGCTPNAYPFTEGGVFVTGGWASS